MVTAMLFYDLLFDITWLIPEQCHYIVFAVATVLRFHVLMATISHAFPRFSRLPCSLYIPSSHHIQTKKQPSTKAWNVLYNQTDLSLGLLQRLFLLFFLFLFFFFFACLYYSLN